MRIQVNKREKLLAVAINHGCPRQVIQVKPFDLDTVITSIDASPNDKKPTRITVKKQLAMCTKFMKDPFSKPVVYGIGSQSNDVQAKLIATVMMIKMIQLHVEDKKIRLPKWHRILGNYKDELRDSPIKKSIGALIISNVDVQSSNTKVEKLIDILEIYSHIPRIVLVSGDDPITYFSNIRYPINNSMFVSSRKIIL